MYEALDLISPRVPDQPVGVHKTHSTFMLHATAALTGPYRIFNVKVSIHMVERNRNCGGIRVDAPARASQAHDGVRFAIESRWGISASHCLLMRSSKRLHTWQLWKKIRCKTNARQALGSKLASHHLRSGHTAVALLAVGGELSQAQSLDLHQGLTSQGLNHLDGPLKKKMPLIVACAVRR